MASHISEDEFLRLQNQLIELRTTNYSLEEKYARQISRCQQLQTQADTLEKECAQAHISAVGAKRMANADIILQNNRLQMKLEAQEGEFRLQNETLMQELSSLCQENKRLTEIANATSVDDTSESMSSEQVKMLKAETVELQRTLSKEKLQAEQEICKLKEIIRIFMNEIEEEIQNEVFGSGNLAPFPKEENSPSCLGTIEEKGIRAECTKVGEEVQEGSNKEVSILSPCRLAELELADAMEELQMPTVDNQKAESLERRCLELRNKYDNYKKKTAKKVKELEERLQLILDEQKKKLDVIDKFNLHKAELEMQLTHLKYEVHDCGLENEVLQTELLKSVKELEELNQQMATLQMENQEKAKSLSEAKKRVQSVMDSMERLRREKDRQIAVLEKQLVDREAEQSLRERKGVVVCRDLKRQLAAERRRVERLQERMREVLEGTHLKLGNESSKTADADSTSLPPWSLMSSNNEQHNSSTGESSSVAVSPTNLNGNLFPQSVDLDREQESRNLLERVASLQEEKWALEERVNHLEQGNAAMIQDLKNKKEVIQFYCMDGRHEPVPVSSGKKAVKKLSDFLKTSEEEHLQECNARMQRMLEELLMKNMHLQRDIEEMSKSLEKLQLSGKLSQ